MEQRFGGIAGDIRAGIRGRGVHSHSTRLQRRRCHERGWLLLDDATVAMGTRPPVSIQLESRLAPRRHLKSSFFGGGTTDHVCFER